MLSTTQGEVLVALARLTNEVPAAARERCWPAVQCMLDAVGLPAADYRFLVEQRPFAHLPPALKPRRATPTAAEERRICYSLTKYDAVPDTQPDGTPIHDGDLDVATGLTSLAELSSVLGITETAVRLHLANAAKKASPAGTGAVRRRHAWGQFGGLLVFKWLSRPPTPVELATPTLADAVARLTATEAARRYPRKY